MKLEKILLYLLCSPVCHFCVIFVNFITDKIESELCTCQTLRPGAGERNNSQPLPPRIGIIYRSRFFVKRRSLTVGCSNRDDPPESHITSKTSVCRSSILNGRRSPCRLFQDGSGLALVFCSRRRIPPASLPVYRRRQEARRGR